MKCQYCGGNGEVSYYEEIGRDEHTITVQKTRRVCRYCNGTGRKPKTKADRVRSMTDEELAEFIARIALRCARDVLDDDAQLPDDFVSWVLETIKQPAKEAK